MKNRFIAYVVALGLFISPAMAHALCFKAEAVVNTAATPCLVTLASDGKIGIGITTPPAQLSIVGPGTAPLSGTGHSYGMYIYRDTGPGVGYIDVLTASTNNTNLHMRVYNGGVYQTVFFGQYTGRVGINNTNPQARLHVSSSFNEHKLMISGYGNSYGYGALFQPANDSSTTPLGFNNAAGTSVGSIQTTASNTSFNTTSDYRLKENLAPIPNALDRVGALNPVAYNFKNDPDVRTEGFVAHEVQTVAPYAVSGVKDALDADGKPIYQQVDYGKLTPLLAAAIQELRVENAALRAEIEALKSSH